MIDINQKALALWNEVRAEREYTYKHTSINRETDMAEALCRAIEQREATKQELADFKQKVSDAIQSDVDYQIANKVLPQYRANIVRFIIPKPKPDPLTEVWSELFMNEYNLYEFVAALEARGLEIREKNDAH